MTTSLRDFIKETGKTVAITITGGGSDVFPSLLQEGGMSSLFLGGEIPYSEDRLNYLTLHKMRGWKAVSQEVSIELAEYTWRAYKPELAIGVTASLYKEGEREGRENKVWVTVLNKEFGESLEMFFDKKDRLWQEKEIKNVIKITMEYLINGQ